MTMRVLIVVTLMGLSLATPIEQPVEKAPAEARSGPMNPSPADPVRRDGAHHGVGGHSGSFHAPAATGHSSYSESIPTQTHLGGHSAGFSSGHSKGHGGAGFSSGQSKGHGGAGFSSGHSKGHGGVGFSSGHSKGHAGAGHHVSQNQIIGSGYGAPPKQQRPLQTYQPPKQTGYYYYYYPVTIQEDKKSSKGFFGKMKDLFKPMMYPWDTMMDYFGYGDENDYDYDSYSHYRSITSRASDYVPWDMVNEVGDHVTQGQCIEFYMCELGSFGRDYKSVHFLLDYLLPEDNINNYSRSFLDSMRQEKDCYEEYKCPIIRRQEIGVESTPAEE